jgi:hypothetical protein
MVIAKSAVAATKEPIKKGFISSKVNIVFE